MRVCRNRHACFLHGNDESSARFVVVGFADAEEHVVCACVDEGRRRARPVLTVNGIFRVKSRRDGYACAVCGCVVSERDVLRERITDVGRIYGCDCVKRESRVVCAHVRAVFVRNRKRDVEICTRVRRCVRADRFDGQARAVSVRKTDD